MDKTDNIRLLPILAGCWALFLGMALIMLGNGLQASLLGVRAAMEDFGTTMTGVVMSGYFLGLIFGCKYVPLMVKKVGHIRIFGALASLASTAILMQAIFVDPLMWWVMRLVTGYSYAGLYIVAESWLNEASDNKTRGKVFSVYMLINFGGLGGGQLLLNAAPPSSFELFLIVSLLISLAVIPILVSASRAPQFEVMENTGIFMLYNVSPVGVVGILVSGLVMGTVFGMGPVYATDTGMSVAQVSLFMGTIILGGFLFQYPLGWLSDVFGRSKIILLSTIAGSAISLAATQLAGTENSGMLFPIVIGIFGGLALSLYALCSVHINDYLTPIQMVAASGTMVLLSAVGATLGSPVTAFFMERLGPNSFFGTISVTFLLFAFFTFWRLTRQDRLEKEEQSSFVVMTASPLSASLTPDVELKDLEAAINEEPEAIQSSFEELIKETESSVDEKS